MPDNMEQNALTEAVYYILLSLLTPMHGYGIMQRVKEMSNSRVNIGPGTLYGALNTLVDKQWIIPLSSETDTRKKEYHITTTGRLVLNHELKRLAELLSNGQQLLKEEKQ